MDRTKTWGKTDGKTCDMLDLSWSPGGFLEGFGIGFLKDDDAKFERSFV
jgi:hypothetical protein